MVNYISRALTAFIRKRNRTLALAITLALGLSAASPMPALAADIQTGVPTTITPSIGPGIGANGTVVGFGGQEWWVIGYNGSGVYSQQYTATLLVKGNNPYSNTAFRSQNGGVYEGTYTNPSDYANSTLANYLNSVNVLETFDTREQARIIARTLTSADGIGGVNVPNQKLWALSTDERDAINNVPTLAYGYNWWFRSYYDSNRVFILGGNGSDQNYYNALAEIAARPAFNLDLTTVLFTSAASGANVKPSAVGSLAAANAPTGAIKFTFRDYALATPTLTLAGTTNNTDEIRFGYTGATTGTNQYVSCVLEQSGVMKYYGKLADCVTSGSGTLSIPISGLAPGSYDLKIFSEQANGDNLSDFAGTSVTMKLAVLDDAGTVSNFGGTVDNDAPALTAGTANRTSDAAATVKFTSGEAGTYFYTIASVAPANAAAVKAADGSAGVGIGTSETSITITSLTAGAKTIYIVVEDAAGNLSDILAVDIPAYITAPNAPTIGTATAGNGQATVTFTAPTNDGGSAITGYTVTSSGGQTATGTASPITVTGLTNGTAYTFTVTATNSVGTSTASAASNSVTPATVPDAPTIGTATAGNGQATVTFTAPTNDGGSAISSYTVTSSGGQPATGTASPITVTGLTNGTAYTFTVTATNGEGTSTASAASNSVTPATVPDAPTIGTATAGNGQATVTFTAPTNDGGSAISGYTVTSSGGQTATGTASPITVTGLTNGTAYTFTVTAANGVGTGAASAASNSVTPTAPIIVVPNPDPAPDPTIYVTGVRLNLTSLEGKVGDDGVELIATVSPRFATDKNVRWSTSDPLVATVTFYGLVNFVGAGTATITVITLDGDYTAECVVTVGTDTGIEDVDSALKVYFHGNTLHVSSPATETIEVYSFSGERIFSARKDAGEASFTVPTSQKAVIVRGSSGWTKKMGN
jgi:hypothetical protein